MRRKVGDSAFPWEMRNRPHREITRFLRKSDANFIEGAPSFSRKKRYGTQSAPTRLLRESDTISGGRLRVSLDKSIRISGRAKRIPLRDTAFSWRSDTRLRGSLRVLGESDTESSGKLRVFLRNAMSATVGDSAFPCTTRNRAQRAIPRLLAASDTDLIGRFRVSWGEAVRNPVATYAFFGRGRSGFQRGETRLLGNVDTGFRERLPFFFEKPIRISIWILAFS